MISKDRELQMKILQDQGLTTLKAIQQKRLFSEGMTTAGAEAVWKASFC